MTLDNILEEVKKAQTIVVLTHESPDGDAVSSSLSVMHAISQLNKKVDIVIPEYSKDFKFLPGSEKILEKGKYENYDLAISVDCTDLKRLEGAKEYFETAKMTIEIDHHSVNAMYADLNYVDPVAPACCQVLIGILEYFGIEIDKEIGTCILTGIITDTGGFQYSGVTPETFEFAAELLRKGVNISQICQKVLRNKTKANCELTKLLYDRMEFLEEGKIVISYITIEDNKNVNAQIGDDEGLVEIERDIELAKKTGVKYHVCHISTKESVELIRKAKQDNVDITCETGPHYLILDDMMLQEDGRFKMNPPIRSKEDRQALIEGILDGTIDMIATDHAPHSEEEKSKGLEKSVMGIVGLETAFPLLYTYFVKEGIISLEKLVELMNTNPRERFEIGTEIKVGEKADLTVYDLNEKYIIDSNNFASKGKSTPFNGYEVFGKCKMTMVGGKIIFNEI